VTVKPVATKVTACAGQGGSEFKAGTSTTLACNGQTGYTETLPPGKSEHGVWSVLYSATAPGQVMSASISFNIPLAPPVASGITNFIGFEGGEGEEFENKSAIPSHCKGTVELPEAIKGNLCVFTRTNENAVFSILGAGFIDPQSGKTETAGPSGVVMDFGAKETGSAFADGTWVVAAE
jgi:hypothetical protein